MVIQIDDDFDLDKIADSGQCFRWEKLCGSSVLLNGGSTASYRIISGGDCLYISALGDGCYELDCTEDRYNRFWMDYFDLGENYRDIRDQIDSERDPFLWEAAKHEQGIRILRQDPWEMLITFIISQNKNIPAIRRSVEFLAESCGEKKIDSRGVEYYAFPTPGAIVSLSDEALKACKLGYRCSYVRRAAEAVAEGKLDLQSLLSADEECTLQELTSLYGVGSKVANCISLFGLHHLDAFPKDVWIKRVLSQEYPEGYPFAAYSPYNGVYQQYMFAYIRKKGAVH